MKRRLFFILAVVLMISSLHVNSQFLVSRKDSIPLANDTIIKLTLPKYRGNIQWQKSHDGVHWNDLVNSNADTLRVKPSVEALYRAKITDGNCLPLYSDTVGIVTRDTVASNYVIPSASGCALISDSTDLSEGRYIYVGSAAKEIFETGKVIIDTTCYAIRKITDVLVRGDTVITTTAQATLEDIFLDTSFKLSTSMIRPVQNLKSASPGAITRALTDDEGFIHPVSVVYRSEEGKVLKKASVFDQKTAGP